MNLSKHATQHDKQSNIHLVTLFCPPTYFAYHYDKYKELIYFGIFQNDSNELDNSEKQTSKCQTSQMISEGSIHTSDYWVANASLARPLTKVPNTASTSTNKLT